ncbi:MAG TPA: DUF5985 family protein [Ramlibacter sp.]|jgi:hypothetical protein|uniref:DUF5985 family protein n=1 Tax=Ramlibacter sp. TaxID=1917967 RepID=UPI002D411A85|nr:DUF5985 family protein [Ramlibacter sp.]HZY16940.1 DUF5985 family protein [Ramlibacter sp.]
MTVQQMMFGATAMGSLLAGLFFLRFWLQTRDPFFLYLTGSFWLQAAHRTALELVPYASEDEPMFYLVRLLAYGLILVAIWQKNRRRRDRPSQPASERR